MAYHRFTLSTADVEDLLAERGVIVSRETVRLWVNRFGRHSRQLRATANASGSFVKFEKGSKKWNFVPLLIRILNAFSIVQPKIAEYGSKMTLPVQKVEQSGEQYSARKNFATEPFKGGARPHSGLDNLTPMEFLRRKAMDKMAT